LKLLIVESNGLFREAFVRRFRSAEDVELVGDIASIDPAALPAEVEVLEPDIVLMGVGVADADTLAAVSRVMAGRRHPGVVLHGRSLTLPAALRIADILRSIDRGFAYLDSDRIQSVDGLVARWEGRYRP
jgi:DNA-binding NarL/FixJ family response regulator